VTGIAVEVAVATPAIEFIVTAYGVLVHLEGIAENSPAIEDVVPAVGTAVH
jgi:hypothetical protein